MKSEFIHSNPNAPVMVVFGGNPDMRHRVVTMLEEFNRVTVYATLSEEEGLNKLKSLPSVHFVLIGGRYSASQRERIRNFVRQNMPQVHISEPGIHYPYGDDGVKMDILQKLNLT